MYRELVSLASQGKPIRVAVTGAGGFMGRGICLQLGITPGFRLVAAVDVDQSQAAEAARLYGAPWIEATSKAGIAQALAHDRTVVTDDFFALLDQTQNPIDVLVESTNNLGFALRAVEAALRNGIHVVLMNAELDCFFGPWLHHVAEASGTLVSSDAGDQHGVLLRLLEEIQLWGLEVVMAGNIKGFLDRYATPTSILAEAKLRNLDPVACAAMTDGTKLNIEMALVANATGLIPARPGMIGPRAQHVGEVFDQFDLPSLRNPGVVDYLLGAEPGGGVFAVGYCEHPVQREYLKYYKMGQGPFYLFYRPYHLCHMETPYAIASLAIGKRPILIPQRRRVADVVAYAKCDLTATSEIPIGLGGEHLYGMIERQTTLRSSEQVPISLFEQEPGEQRVRITRPVRKDQPITWADIDLPDTHLVETFHRQQSLLGAP
ncbi:MAG: NAD(P)H-dependent oxidoreductase [Gammaproteobacteria bacterium]